MPTVIRAVLSLLAVLALSLGTLLGTTSVASAQEPGCTRVLITVVGSNELGGSRIINAVERGWRAEATRFSTNRAVIVPVDYPAVPATRYVDWFRIIQPGDRGLEKSEQKGMKRLTQILKDVQASCPAGNREIAVAGYSQGADVVARTLSQPGLVTTSHSVRVVLIGNPSFIPPPVGPAGSFDGTFGNYDHSKRGIRPSFHVATFPNPPGARVRTWNVCVRYDQICNFFPGQGWDFGPHTNLYHGQGGLAERAGVEVYKIFDAS